MLSIFSFLDYREYLNALFEERKKESPWYSFKVMGDGVGLDQSQVYRILQKQLHISKVALPRFQKYLELTGPAAEYFALLVTFGRTRKEKEARVLFEEILQKRGSHVRILDHEQFLLYSEWHHPVIRALVNIREFRDEYEQMGRSLTPPLRGPQVRKSLELLRKLKLVERDQDGIWRAKESSVSTGNTFHSLVVRNYQAESMRLAQESLERHDKSLRDIHVLNIAVDQDAFSDCLQILESARAQIRQRLERVQKPDRVMRLAHALFPVALLEKENRK